MHSRSLSVLLVLAACGSSSDKKPDAAAPITIGGTVTGLTGTGLVLQDSAGEQLPVTADGSFTFAMTVQSGSDVTVSVAQQPTNPTQMCSVAGGTLTAVTANVTDIAVTCSTNTYALGGTVTGLAGAGLTLQVNGGETVPVMADGSFTFPTHLPSGQSYTVVVAAQPTGPWQTCMVANATGTITTADVTNVTVACATNSYSVGGTVMGLSGSGLVLRNNGGDDLAISANGTFTFATQVASGQSFDVSVLSQPTAPWQSCQVMGGTGMVGGADVTSIVINCTTNLYTIGGTVTGLTGAGLVLQNNGGDDLTISGAGTFAFSTAIPSGGMYSVSVQTNPTTPWQTCVVSPSTATGTVTNANVTSVDITCTTNQYPVSVSVTGLVGGGLVLQNNGADNLSIPANGTYTFATQVASGSMYNVTVLANPTSPSQTCTVASPMGTMPDGVTLAVTCVTNKYTVGGTVTNLVGTGLVLQNNAGDDLAITASGPFTFATPIASGAPYAVTVKTQPTGQTCTVVNGSGTVTTAAITSVAVKCALVTYTLTLDGSTVPAGWYSGNAAGAVHDASNPNYAVGPYSGSPPFLRDYFVFNMTGIPTTATVTAVTLTAQNPCNASGPAGYPWEAHFFSTDATQITALEATQSGAAGGAIWAQLGGGSALGSTVVTNIAANPLSMTFNATGVATVQSSLGKRAAFGTTYAEASNVANGYILACSTSGPNSANVTLTVTTAQ